MLIYIVVWVLQSFIQRPSSLTILYCLQRPVVLFELVRLGGHIVVVRNEFLSSTHAEAWKTIVRLLFFLFFRFSAPELVPAQICFDRGLGIAATGTHAFHANREITIYAV